MKVPIGNENGILIPEIPKRIGMYTSMKIPKNNANNNASFFQKPIIPTLLDRTSPVILQRTRPVITSKMIDTRTQQRTGTYLSKYDAIADTAVKITSLIIVCVCM